MNNDATEVFERSMPIVEHAKLLIPSYHTRAIRSAMFEKFGRINYRVKLGTLRYFYRDLTGDESASSSTEQLMVVRRIQQVLEMEDPDVLPDLRALNLGKKNMFHTFWEECENFLNEDICTAVDDRRHSQIRHLARAISVRNLIEQVKQRCPAETMIPSQEWLRLQFWPKTPSAKVSLAYTGRFKVKYMFQQRQWRHSHPDAHYAAAIFRYMR